MYTDKTIQAFCSPSKMLSYSGTFVEIRPILKKIYKFEVSGTNIHLNLFVVPLLIGFQFERFS